MAKQCPKCQMIASWEYDYCPMCGSQYNPPSRQIRKRWIHQERRFKLNQRKLHYESLDHDMCPSG